MVAGRLALVGKTGTEVPWATVVALVLPFSNVVTNEKQCHRCGPCGRAVIDLLAATTALLDWLGCQLEGVQKHETPLSMTATWIP